MSTTYYDRRKDHIDISFSDRREINRRNGKQEVYSNRRRLADQVRSSNRSPIRIPVFSSKNKIKAQGYTKDIGPGGLCVTIDSFLPVGTPINLEFDFASVCYINISGQVISIKEENNGASSRIAHIRFSGILEWEQAIISSAVQQIMTNEAYQQKSLLNLVVTEDKFAKEVGRAFKEARDSGRDGRSVDIGRRAELRKSLRFNVDIRVRHPELKKSVEYRAESIDISFLGLCLSSDVRLPEVEHGIVEIAFQEAKILENARVRLRWRDDSKNYYGFDLPPDIGDLLPEWKKIVHESEAKIIGRRKTLKDRRDLGDPVRSKASFKNRRRGVRRIADFSLSQGTESGSEKLRVLRSDLLPRPKDTDYTLEALNTRRKWLQDKTGVDLKHSSIFTESPDNMRGNIENLVGVSHIPIGISGPLRVNGDYAKGVFYVPMATTEGAIVYTYTRGMQLISLAGGANSAVLRDEIHISPIFVFSNSARARIFEAWLIRNFVRIKEVAEKTTRYGKLIRLEPHIFDKNVVVKFCYTTGDAMGLNMINIATEEACRLIVPTVKPDEFYMRSNFSSVKKISAHNYSVAGFGKTVIAEVNVPRSLLFRHFGLTPEQMARYCQLSFISSAHAGMIGMNGHIANGLTAIFIACGQDVANVVDSQASISACEVTREGDLYVSVKIPNLVIGTVGGGVSLGTQKECLDLIDCYGTGKAKKLSEIIVASVLAGEIGVAAAIVSGTFVNAHKNYGRKPSNMEQRGQG
jgi:hydroxymethylglutaryl-CoA reductase (NADPH)